MFVAAYIHRTGGVFRTVQCETLAQAFSICNYLAATMGHALSDEQREDLKAHTIVEFGTGACVQMNELEAFDSVNKESLIAYEATLGQLREQLEASESVEKAIDWLHSDKGRSLAREAGLGKLTPKQIIQAFPTAKSKV